MNFSFKCSFRELTPIRVYTVPQSRTERRKRLKFHIQSRFLYKKIICTRKTRVICMNVRCIYKTFTNIFRCRMSRNIMHYGGDRFKSRAYWQVRCWKQQKEGWHGIFYWQRKLGGVRAFAEWESFLNHTEKPDPKQVFRRACREISANGKFEEGYLKVHGASAWQLYLLFC